MILLEVFAEQVDGVRDDLLNQILPLHKAFVGRLILSSLDTFLFVSGCPMPSSLLCFWLD